MSPSESERPVIEVTERAREALLDHVRGEGGRADDATMRYVRIHVGRG